MKRRALITGGASGIGRAVADRMLSAGWRVLVLDKAPRPADLDSDVTYVEADVSKISEVEPLLANFSDGCLDALVNNAAVQPTGPVLDVGVEHWRRVMEVNLVATAAAARTCREWLKRAGGSIVNVASVHSIATSPHIGVYAASKAALLSLTRTLALELAGDGIRVNAILPGAVDTEMLRQGLARTGSQVEVALDALGSRTVMGRVGQPEEIAEGVLFLADYEKSSFMTGSALVMDGGALARLSTE